MLLAGLLGDHESLKVSCIDHSTIDLELSEGIIDLAGGELVAEGHQLSSEGLSVNLSVLLKSLEGSEDDIIVIGTTGHLGGEQGDHLGEVHGSINLVKHGLSVSAADALAMSSEGSDKVGGGQETILVSIHDTEGFLELLDGGVRERFEDVSFLRHLVSCVVVTGGEIYLNKSNKITGCRE